MALNLQTETFEVVKNMEEKTVKSITINRPKETVYRFWRRFENLPLFMKNLESVQTIEPHKSHWKAKGAVGKSFEWDAEIVEEKVNEYIIWHSLEDAEVENSGAVQFTESPEKAGTEVTVVLGYNPPAGEAGRNIARLFGADPAQQLDEDLKRLKESLERGAERIVESTELLRKDHEKIKGLFRRYGAMNTPAEKEILAREVIREFRIHTDLEEQVFYPVVREKTEDGEQVMDFIEAHDEAGEIISDLEDASPADEEYDELFEKLADAVSSHIDEEEAEMLPKVEKAKNIDFDTLNREMKEYKRRLKQAYSYV